MAVDIDHRSLKTKLLGQDVAMPVAIAPTGLTGMQHADGEMLAALAARDFGIPFTLSTMSVCSLEDVAQATRAPFWFQLYVMRDRSFIENLIARAKAANCSALVLTLDLQVLGQRHKDIKNGLTTPPKPTIPNLLNLFTKPRWCLGMLGTPRRTFTTDSATLQGVDVLWVTVDTPVSEDDVADVGGGGESPVLEYYACHQPVPLQCELPAGVGQLDSGDMPAHGQLRLRAGVTQKAPINIPVAFHVVHDGKSGQVTSAQIDTLIHNLNWAFRDTPFSFYLRVTNTVTNSAWSHGCAPGSCRRSGGRAGRCRPACRGRRLPDPQDGSARRRSDPR